MIIILNPVLSLDYSFSEFYSAGTRDTGALHHHSRDSQCIDERIVWIRRFKIFSYVQKKYVICVNIFDQTINEHDNYCAPFVALDKFIPVGLVKMFSRKYYTGRKGGRIWIIPRMLGVVQILNEIFLFSQFCVVWIY